MSYFLNNIKRDKYIIDEKYLGDYEGFVELPLIEIFNKDDIEFDFSNVWFVSKNEKLKTANIAINKIVIDYGDGHKETLHEILKSKPSFIGSFIERNWKITNHSFFTEKKHIYEEDLKEENHPRISITFFNQFNDRYYFSIPYKILYKSFYNEGSSFNLIDANINNKNTTSFTIREPKNNNLIVVSAKKYATDEIYFSNPSFIVDESDDYFVDDDVMTWNWSVIPDINIVKAEAISDNQEYYTVSLEWREKNINIYNFNLSKKLIGSSNDPSPIDVKFDDLGYKEKIDETGLYQYIFDLVGINDKRNTKFLYLNCSPSNPCDISESKDKPLINETEKKTINGEDIDCVVSKKSFDINFIIPKLGSTPPSLDTYNKLIFTLYNEEKSTPFVYDILKNRDIVTENDGLFTLNVETDTIPDGKYNIQLKVEDVLGNIGNEIKHNDVVSPIENFHISYIIGKFKDESLTVKDVDRVDKTFKIDEKDFTLNWDFVDINDENNPGNVDYFEISLTPIA